MSNIRILNNNDQGLLETYLKPLLSTSMFLISNSRAAGLEYSGETYSGEYLGAFDGAQLIGVLCKGWSGIVLPQAPLELIPELYSKMSELSTRAIKGFVGSREQVELLQELSNVSSSELKLDTNEILFDLDLNEFSPPALENGFSFSTATSNELDIITRWRVNYSTETLGDEESEELKQTIRSQVERMIGQGSVYVLRDKGVPVSMAAYNARIAEAVQIGGVFTPKELRSRGYARRATTAVLQAATEFGCSKALLFTGDYNIPAQKAYLSLGFKQIGEYRIALKY